VVDASTITLPDNLQASDISIITRDGRRVPFTIAFTPGTVEYMRNLVRPLLEVGGLSSFAEEWQKTFAMRFARWFRRKSQITEKDVGGGGGGGTIADEGGGGGGGNKKRNILTGEMVFERNDLRHTAINSFRTLSNRYKEMRRPEGGGPKKTRISSSLFTQSPEIAFTSGTFTINMQRDETILVLEDVASDPSVPQNIREYVTGLLSATNTLNPLGALSGKGTSRFNKTSHNTQLAIAGASIITVAGLSWMIANWGWISAYIFPAELTSWERDPFDNAAFDRRLWSDWVPEPMQPMVWAHNYYINNLRNKAKERWCRYHGLSCGGIDDELGPGPMGAKADMCPDEFISHLAHHFAKHAEETHREIEKGKARKVKKAIR
jgi:hypothetical protein